MYSLCPAHTQSFPSEVPKETEETEVKVGASEEDSARGESGKNSAHKGGGSGRRGKTVVR